MSINKNTFFVNFHLDRLFSVGFFEKKAFDDGKINVLREGIEGFLGFLKAESLEKDFYTFLIQYEGCAFEFSVGRE